jgi:hypothetical protein
MCCRVTVRDDVLWEANGFPYRHRGTRIVGNGLLLVGLEIENYARLAHPVISFVDRVRHESAVRVMKPPNLQ